MPISTPAALDGVVATTFGDTAQIAATTPTADAFVILFGFANRPAGEKFLNDIAYDTSDANMQGTGDINAWTDRGSTVTGARNANLECYTGQAASSTSSAVNDLTWTATSSQMGGIMCEIASGWDTTTPVVQVKTGTFGAVSSSSVTLDSAPSSGNMVVAAVMCHDEGGGMSTSVGPTAGSGWTELDEVLQGHHHCFLQYRTGSTSTTVDFSGFDSASDYGCIFAIEIAEEAAAGGSPIPVILPILNHIGGIG